ncbi:MAG: hypothetical protein WD469_10415 [Paenibacillaceae bacterium]
MINLNDIHAVHTTTKITNDTDIREATNITNPTTDAKAIIDVNALANNVHQTGKLVIESGAYFCEVGEKKEFSMGDTFPVCPLNGNQTVWHHANHEHKSGERVLETAQYYCTSGMHLDLKKGDLFPVCPNNGVDTIWKHSE